jgi:hypothetical protein
VTASGRSIAHVAVLLLFWAAALLALTMALIPNPPAIINDKVQHMGAFAVLGLLGSLAYPRIPHRWILVGLSLFGAAIEIAQGIPAFHRDSDPLDWLADTIACAIVLTAVRLWRGQRR